MASVTKQQIPSVAQFMPEFWNLVKQYWVPEPNQLYCDNLVDSCSKLRQKYKEIATPEEFCFIDGQISKFVEYLAMRGEMR